MANVRRYPLRLNPTLVPTVPVEVDWSHPLAQGLIAEFLPGNSPFDLASIQGPIVGTNTPASQSTPIGSGLRFNGSSQYARIDGEFSPSGMSVSVTVQFYSLPSGGFNSNIWIQDAFGGAGFGAQLFLDGNNPHLYLVIGGHPVELPFSSAVVIGVPYRICCTWDGLAARGYVNGVPSPSVGAAGSMRGNGSNMTLAVDPGSGPGRYGNISIVNFRYANRAWTADEVAADAAEPFVMLRPRLLRRTWSFASGPIYSRPRVMLIA